MGVRLQRERFLAGKYLGDKSSRLRGRCEIEIRFGCEKWVRLARDRVWSQASAVLVLKARI